jgi:hypothetical protein
LYPPAYRARPEACLPRRYLGRDKPHPGRHTVTPQHVPGMQAYPGGHCEFELHCWSPAHRLSTQQKQLPSTSWLQ